MWFFKLILLLTLIASWIPKDGKAQVNPSHSISIDMEGEEQEDGEGSEEAAA